MESQVPMQEGVSGKKGSSTMVCSTKQDTMHLCFDKHHCRTFLGWKGKFPGGGRVTAVVDCACHKIMNQAMLPQAQFPGSGPAASAHYMELDVCSCTKESARWRQAHSQSRGLLATLLPDLDRPRVGEEKGEQGL